MFDDIFSQRGLSLERLHTLLKLSESRSLIQAANSDLGKQSRLSHHLRELSEYFGVDLTERAGKTIKLTTAGESLVKITREHFLALQAFRSRAVQTIPTLRIAASDNLTQWLLVPAIARIRRPSNPVRFQLSNLRTKDIIVQLKDRRVDFGLLRSDAVEAPLKNVAICQQRYAIFVPQRLVSSRGLLKIKDALLGCPHAAIGGDGQLMARLKELASEQGGVFNPELQCDSIGQCVAAVRTGSFAAVLPVQAWPDSSENEYVVVEDQSLEALNRKIVLAWDPRTAEVLGTVGRKIQQSLTEALKAQGTVLD